MPLATFNQSDRLGEIVIDSPPMNLFSGELLADLRAAVDQGVVDGIDLGAGHTEDVFDALRCEHVDDLLRAADGFTGGCGGHVASLVAGAVIRSTRVRPSVAVRRAGLRLRLPRMCLLPTRRIRRGGSAAPRRAGRRWSR